MITQLSQLPGIGPKTASRLVFFMLRNGQLDLKSLGEAVTKLKEDLVYCETCHNIAEESPCATCLDKHRDATAICVVEEPLDVVALERAGFRGLYHVLGGAISPLEGIGPHDIHIEDLVSRLAAHPKVREVIIATNPDVEGEATAMYIQRLLTPLGIKVTRIARGLPVGSDLGYADETTLTRALEGRKEY